MSNSNELKLNLTEGQINNAIAIAVAEAFSPEKRDALLRDVIRTHLTLKTDRYDKESLFAANVNKQLQAMVAEEMNKQIASMRPEVEAAVTKFFGPGLRASLTEQIEKSLSKALMRDFAVTITPVSYD